MIVYTRDGSAQTTVHNGVSPLYIMLEIHHSGREPSIYCHTAIDVADEPLYLTHSPYIDTGQTNPSADLITPGTLQGTH